MDNKTPLQPETVLGTTSAVEKRFKDVEPQGHVSGVWTSEAHPETSVEKHVRWTLYRIYFASSIFVAVCIATLLIAGHVIYQKAIYVDPVSPDHSALDTESNTYWKDRTLIDIETAQNSEGTEELRALRLRTFVNNTVKDALSIESPHSRAQAVTEIAMTLAQNDINILLDAVLQQLGNTTLIASMRGRTLISQALMHIRKGRFPTAQVTMQQYNQLVADSDLKLNFPLNEESFFGAVTVLWFLNNRDGLRELFTHWTVSTSDIGREQQMRAYRLIAGEQVRVGMIAEALETAERINNHVELVRAWTLILQCAARPPTLLPVEPRMLDIPDTPLTNSQVHTAFAQRVAEDIFLYLAANKDANSQISLLRQIAGSRLMRDAELHKLFRESLDRSDVLDDWVKQPVLKLLDDPESPAIRATLNMPPRTSPVSSQTEVVIDDWTTLADTIQVETVDIDPASFHVRTEQQWVQALLAVAQSYQSIRRFEDADRVLKQAFIAAQRFSDITPLLRIGEQQAAIGSIANARQTFVAVASGGNQNQRGELARLQIIARLFDDARTTIESIESPANREYVSTFLLQELIRLHRLDDAERMLTLIPQGRPAAEAQSRLNIAKEQASEADFNALAIPVPNQELERHCAALIRQGFLHSANQAADRIGDVRVRADVRTKIAQKYLFLYRSFNDENDPSRSNRQEIRQSIITTASRTGQPAAQTAVLAELLMLLAGQTQTEAQRADNLQLWAQAMDACRRVVLPNERVTSFAQLIVVKNMLDNPDLTQQTLPLFTREAYPAIYDENYRLIEECTELVNSLDQEEQQANACIHLVRALAQIGRTKTAQTLLEHVLDIATHTSESAESVSILLSMVPVMRAMNSTDAIPGIYRLAIDRIAHGFTGRTSRVDEFEWRMRDSDIEQIIRSQMENGFVDNAVESTERLNEPVLRDRLLRTAVHAYLDQRNFDKAEQTSRRLTVRDIQNSVNQNIQTFQRRSALSDEL